MLYGITYMVLPVIAPASNPCNFCFIFAGSSQLLVGPASSWVRGQMKVRSSTRATSPGLDRTRMLFGGLSSASQTALPVRTISRSMAWYSSCEPSHQCTRSGLQSWATSSTHAVSRLCFVSAFFSVMVSISEYISKMRLDMRTLSSNSKLHHPTPRHENGIRGQKGEAARKESARATRDRVYIVPHFEGSFQLAGGSDRGFDLRHDAFQMLESLVDGERIHFATQAFAGFQRRFQKMAGDFLRQGIGDQPSGAVLVLDPGRVRQGDPDGTPVDQELDVHRIGVAGGDGHHQGLVKAVYLFLGPAVGGGEVSEHKELKTRISGKYVPGKYIAGRGRGANGWGSRSCWIRRFTRSKFRLIHYRKTTLQRSEMLC